VIWSLYNDFKGPTSCGLISQLLRYGVLTLGGLLHPHLSSKPPASISWTLPPSP
jgi:hypothetical protein